MRPIVSKTVKGGIPTYIVRKIMTDEATELCQREFMKDSNFPVVLKESADVYTEDGNLLVRFRKNVLSPKKLDDTYEAIKDFARNVSSDRGIAGGSKPGTATGDKIKVRSNIMGYFDTWTLDHKGIFKRAGIKPPAPCRVCAFNTNHPEKWKKVVPLIQEIDEQYKLLCPTEHADQMKAAKSTPFHIRGTSFSTITTNLNFRTAAHKDSGDWPTGFGNLVVIERGAGYTGAYTGFPQYGVAVDCREGDFLAMDVHQVHGNSPFLPADDTSQRLSLVSYLREGIVKKCGGHKMFDAQKFDAKMSAARRQTRKNNRQ